MLMAHRPYPPSLSHKPWITASTLPLWRGSLGPTDLGAVITWCLQHLPWPRTMSISPTAIWRVSLHPLLERPCSRPHHHQPSEVAILGALIIMYVTYPP